MRRIIIALGVTSIMVLASNLDNLLKEYKNAPESQRYKVMNEIKLEIASMHKVKQKAAIDKLRSNHKTLERNHKRTPKTHKKRSRTYKRTNDKVKNHRTNALNAIGYSKGSSHPNPMDVLNGHSHTGSATGSVSGSSSGGGFGGSSSGGGFGGGTGGFK